MRCSDAAPWRSPHPSAAQPVCVNREAAGQALRRSPLASTKAEAIRKLLGTVMSLSQIAEVSVGVGTVHRVKQSATANGNADPADQQAA
jgi:hypothetical protein